MSFSETEKRILWQQMTVVNGIKRFGIYDSLIDTGGATSEIIQSQGTPEVSIVIPVMERPDKFKETLKRLYVSAGQSGKNCEVVVMDNSLEPGLAEVVKETVTTLKQPHEPSVIYHHDPRLTQSTARNLAVNNISTDSPIVGFLDSDIYCNPQILAQLLPSLTGKSELAGIAPPLAPYTGGDIDQTIGSFSHLLQDRAKRAGLHMPGGIGESIGKWNGDILETATMRGAFFITRTLINQVAQVSPDKLPWSPDFVVWQNILFFTTAKELGAHIGYDMTSPTVVHDDRVDEVSVGFRLPLRTPETLKSICLLLYRNQLYQPENKAANERFLRYNIPEIQRVTGLSESGSNQLQELLINIAKVLSVNTDLPEFRKTANSTMEPYPTEIATLANGVVSCLNHPQVFDRVKQLKSSNPSLPIYTV